MTSRVLLALALAGAVSVSAKVAVAQPWASHVVAYSPGTGVDPAFADPLAALGEPTRFTGVGMFPGAVTPFNPAWMPGEIVTIGPGGALTIQFGSPVVNDPLNPYGVDFLIFGNAGYIDTNFPSGVAGGMFGVGGGTIEVSDNGTNWHTIPGITADSAFPTLGYADLLDPYAQQPGSVLADFTRPVDPAFSATGRPFAEIVAAYNGSGGGTGVDIGAVGLGSISYVRISNPAAATVNVDIDAFSIVMPVPGPGALGVFIVGAPMLLIRRRDGRL